MQGWTWIAPHPHDTLGLYPAQKPFKILYAKVRDPSSMWASQVFLALVYSGY
jgi:hypothetical protein